MEPYKRQIIQLLKEKNDYDYGLLGSIAEQYTVGELMRNQLIYDAVVECYGDWFVEDLVRCALDDPEYPFREDILALVPAATLREYSE